MPLSLTTGQWEALKTTQHQFQEAARQFQEQIDTCLPHIICHPPPPSETTRTLFSPEVAQHLAKMVFHDFARSHPQDAVDLLHSYYHPQTLVYEVDDGTGPSGLHITANVRSLSFHYGPRKELTTTQPVFYLLAEVEPGTYGREVFFDPSQTKRLTIEEGQNSLAFSYQKQEWWRIDAPPPPAHRFETRKNRLVSKDML